MNYRNWFSLIPFDAVTLGGDGLYTLFTRAHDAAGNLEAAPATPDAEVHVDTQAPAVPQVAALPAFSAGAARVVTTNSIRHRSNGIDVVPAIAQALRTQLGIA